MERFYTDYKGQLRSGNVELFLQIAIDIYHRLLQYEKDLKPLREIAVFSSKLNHGQFLTEKEKKALNDISILNQEKFKSNIQGIVILASYYEALINEIGRIELGSKYFNQNLDKLSVVSKWEIVLQLIYSESLKTDSQHYELMKAILTERNSLMHYKSQMLENPTLEDKRRGFEKTKKLMKIFIQSVEKLGDFHNELLTIDESKGLLRLFQFSKELKRIKPAHNKELS